MYYNPTIPTATHHYTELHSDQHPVLPISTPSPITPPTKQNYSPTIPLMDLAAIARSIY